MHVRLAHFSDIHVTLSPLGMPWRQLGGKRAAGVLSYYAGGRGRRFGGVNQRISALLEDVDAQQVDHALCTGDLTAVSFQQEFETCAQLFGDRLGRPQSYTVLPGNHDRYVPDAVDRRLFEASFGTLAAPDGGGSPFAKPLCSGVTAVVLDVARPCSFTDSSGLCGPAQLSRVQEILSDASLTDQFVILAMHYGLLRADGQRDSPSHGIRDDLALLEVLDAPHVHLDLILHGHMHRAFTVRSRQRLISCAGSATDLHVACGYNVYSLNLETRTVDSLERRRWDRQQNAYVSAGTTRP